MEDGRGLDGVGAPDLSDMTANGWITAQEKVGGATRDQKRGMSMKRVSMCSACDKPESRTCSTHVLRASAKRSAACRSRTRIMRYAKWRHRRMQKAETFMPISVFGESPLNPHRSY